MNRRLRLAGIGFLVLIVNAGYLVAFTSATLFYMANVLLHLGLGLALTPALSHLWRRARIAAFLFAFSAAMGLYLVVAGNTAGNRWVLWMHICAAAGGVSAMVPWLWQTASPRFRTAFAAAVVFAAMAPVSAYWWRAVSPDPSARIRNPRVVPVSMEEEGAGPHSPFFPSSAKTNVGGIIPANFFMDSERCGECHKDIYEQWKGSMHHFASFNNQFYRKSIEHMQDVVGTRPSKWCAGCHDHAVFFNGRFDRPIKEQVNTPEAQAGLGCMSCHSIVHVASSMGNGALTIEYPPLHELASSRNPLIRKMDYFLTYLNPGPHKKTFMKPFMRQDAAEFCSACHKVHLDVPVNSYRWLRGFNDYDNWQASGVSGQGARSFYYPEKSANCADCHMPLVASQDPGNQRGKVHSHRFPAANTAVPYVTGDAKQLATTEKFLKSGFISVDIFAMSPVEEDKRQTAMIRRAGEAPQAMSTFAVGEEAEQTGQVLLRDVGKVAAPIDQSGALVKPGSTVRVDVVVRTRKIGHFFPGGTVDAFDVWLELQARDADGRIIFWSGRVEDNGRGQVEPGAHFYRSFMLDGEGNPINKRNAWQARSTLYVRLIPPGAADVAHYRVTVPKDARGPISLTARLNHRKFTRYYTQFSFEGHKQVPDLPIVTLADARTQINLGEPGEWAPIVRRQDRERWNDWGIGLLLQGDLKAAEYAFQRVTEAEPGYADGWINVARALIQEGETDAAKPYLEKALAINPKLGRIYFFRAMTEKADGNYDAALASLKTVEALYPRDRVVLNQMARVLFLKREYAPALKVLERVCDVDPEDLQMHYTMMLCYRGLGDMAQAAHSQRLFERFKADESSQAITRIRRAISPEDNNERQPIHEHSSTGGLD